MDKERLKGLRGDVTKPHLKRFFKIVPMRDEDGNAIANNPALSSGFWPKPKHGIKVDKVDGKTNRK